jgi:uncharacterized protein
MSSRWKFALAAAVTAAAATLVTIAVTGGHDERAGATVPRDSTQPSGSEVPSAVDRSITVSGHGTVKVTPDVASVWLGVQTTEETAQEAMDVIGTKSQALVDTLKGVGLAAADIQTSSLSLYPSFGTDGRTINGYQASTNVTATIRDVARVGEILDAVQGFVGEELTLGGISFSYADPEAVLGEARAAALDNARARAQQYADAADAEVGEILRISETPAGVPSPFVAERAAADAAGTLAIEPGSQELAVDVAVVFGMS